MLYNTLDYMTPKVQTEVGVDISKNQQLTINFDFTLPGLPCSGFGIDFTDTSGDLQLDLDKDVKREDIGENACRIFGHHSVNKLKRYREIFISLLVDKLKHRIK
eukprot:TRINITY_DN4729_c0_g1_i1.p1 TRINITY_DN4729_c0_g1~~TRINITY_DN4729_c0_g1_i1.p1  ORF type:complete len:104 (-),score=14.32 TRINITY_DN4729_c0_g1_i1:206-517(-)